jgi:hypothetical protein
LNEVSIYGKFLIWNAFNAVLLKKYVLELLQSDFVGSDMGFDIPFRKWVNEGNPSNAPGVGVVATKEQSIGYCQPEGC